MAQDTAAEYPLPLRGLVLFLLELALIIAAISGIHFLVAEPGHLPGWFRPFLIAIIALLLYITGSYYRLVFHTEAPVSRPSARAVFWIWILLQVSVLCTSALHQFFPFRPEVVGDIRALLCGKMPAIMAYNTFLTAGSFLAILALRVVYGRGRERAALIGLVIVAGIMLMPNDACNNEFNNPWVDMLGASPVMFLANSVLILAGYCGLNGIRPRAAIVFMSILNGCVLLIGLGHVTRIIW